MATQARQNSGLRKTARSLVLTGCWIGLVGPAAAQGDLWHARTQIYGWLPGPGGWTDVRAAGTDELNDLSSLYRVDVANPRRSRFGLVADNLYLSLDSANGPTRDLAGPSPLSGVAVGDSGARLRGSTSTLAGSYTAVDNSRYDVQTLAGLRTFRTDAPMETRCPMTMPGIEVGPTVRTDVWDAILGVRGRVKLGEGNWFAPYYFDVGAGQSDMTWQAFGGIGYKFSWGEIVGSYRHLDYNFSSGSRLRDLSFSGPTISFGFRW